MGIMRIFSLSLVGLLATQIGCARWGQARQYRPKREVSRKMVGAPHVARTSSVSGSAGIGRLFARGPTGGASATAIAGEGGSISRTHCVQEALVTYEQPYDLVPVTVGRSADIVGGTLLTVAGLTSIVVSAIRADSFFEPGDPLYEKPADPTLGYTIGGGLIAAGVGWMGYSFMALPNQAPPPVSSDKNIWTETKLVEATGCGLVPADADRATASNAEERLRKLEDLHASGLLSDDEYEDKRQQILDAI